QDADGSVARVVQCFAHDALGLGGPVCLDALQHLEIHAGLVRSTGAGGEVQRIGPDQLPDGLVRQAAHQSQCLIVAADSHNGSHGTSAAVGKTYRNSIVLFDESLQFIHT